MSKKIVIPKLPPRNKSVILYDGIRQYVVFNLHGRYYAVNHRCPHGGAPLSKGELLMVDGVPKIQCPRHGWIFNLEDGSVPEHPIYCLSTYTVNRDEEISYILVPEFT